MLEVRLMNLDVNNSVVITKWTKIIRRYAYVSWHVSC